MQFGDQYRLVSPYDKGAVAALMYADEKKDQAVVFAYRMDYLHNQSVPTIRLEGVDENKTYRISDITPSDASKPSDLDGKVVSGKVLKNAGLNVRNSLGRPWTSLVLKLTAQ